MRVAFIGLGIMGSRQAANLAKAGHELRVFNRTRETAEAWAEEHGASVADSPRAAAAEADAGITMVVDGAQGGAVLLGGEGGGAPLRGGGPPPGRPRRTPVHRLHHNRTGGRPPHRRDADRAGPRLR